MKHELIFNESESGGNSSNWAHSFLLFSWPPENFGWVLGGGTLFPLPSLFLFTAAKFSELNCCAVSSLFTLPRPTSVVNFPPRTRDDAFLDYISQEQRQNCQSAEPHTQEEKGSWTWPFRNSGLGTNSLAFGKSAMPLCFRNLKGYSWQFVDAVFSSFPFF